MKILVLLAGLIVGCATWWLMHRSDGNEAPVARELSTPLETSAGGPAAEPRPAFAKRPALLPLPHGAPDTPALRAGAEVGTEPSVADRRVYLQSRFATQEP